MSASKHKIVRFSFEEFWTKKNPQPFGQGLAGQGLLQVVGLFHCESIKLVLRVTQLVVCFPVQSVTLRGLL